MDAVIGKQHAVLADLAADKARALAAQDFVALQANAVETSRQRAYLDRLEMVPALRKYLKLKAQEEEWEVCASTQSNIQAMERGHRCFVVKQCDSENGVCEHGPGKLTKPHLACCGHADPAAPCRRLQLQDAVVATKDIVTSRQVTCPQGTKGVLLVLDDKDSELQYGVAFSGSMGEPVWVSADEVALAQEELVLPRPHTAGYRVHDLCTGHSRVLFSGEPPAPISFRCGFSSGQEPGGGCTHELKHPDGIPHSHWMCCGQSDLFSACVQIGARKLGEVVGTRAGIGVVTSVDHQDAVRTYYVALLDGSSVWLHDADVSDTNEAAGRQVLEKSWAPHTGEFHAGSVVLFPRRGEAVFVDGAGEDEPHWSCCGGDLFSAKCEVRARLQEQEPDPVQDLLRGLKSLLNRS
jgi:hypothetical protein